MSAGSGSGAGVGGGGSASGRDLDPSSWTVEEVATFLGINECGTLAEAFTEQVSKLYNIAHTKIKYVD